MPKFACKWSNQKAVWFNLVNGWALTVSMHFSGIMRSSIFFKEVILWHHESTFPILNSSLARNLYSWLMSLFYWRSVARNQQLHGPFLLCEIGPGFIAVITQQHFTRACRHRYCLFTHCLNMVLSWFELIVMHVSRELCVRKGLSLEEYVEMALILHFLTPSQKHCGHSFFCSEYHLTASLFPLSPLESLQHDPHQIYRSVHVLNALPSQHKALNSTSNNVSYHTLFSHFFFFCLDQQLRLAYDLTWTRIFISSAGTGFFICSTGTGFSSALTFEVWLGLSNPIISAGF